MTKSTASIAEVLFGPLDKKTTLDDDKLRPVLLDQYKVYVEMADRISARRQIANTYALSINSALIALVGYLASQKGAASLTDGGLFWTVAIAGMVLNYVWYRMIRSYSDLNTAKFLVIHEIEKRLVISPYDAEWEAVGRGNDKSLYLPFTHIEKWIPWVFFGLHTAVFAKMFPYEFWKYFFSP